MTNVLRIFQMNNISSSSKASQAFERMIAPVLGYNRVQVTKTQYEQFKKEWIFLALSGMRYGQAFCEHFGLDKANPLYYFRDNKISESWINDNYIV